MKKLLSILAAVGLTATASAGVVACGSSAAAETANVITVRMSSDSIWGDGNKSITQYFENAKSGQAKTVADHIKEELGLTSLRDEKGPTMVATYFAKDKKPAVEDGQEMTTAEVNSLADQIIEDHDHKTDAFGEQVKNDNGGTYYQILRSKKAVDDAKDTGKVKIALVKITFKAPAATKADAVKNGKTTADNLSKLKLNVKLSDIEKGDNDTNHTKGSYQQIGETILGSSLGNPAFFNIADIKSAMVAGSNIERNGLKINGKLIDGNTTDTAKAGDTLTVNGNVLSYYHDAYNKLQSVETSFTFTITLAADAK